MKKKHPVTRAERLALDREYSFKRTRSPKLEDKGYEAHAGRIIETPTEEVSLDGGPTSPPWID